MQTPETESQPGNATGRTTYEHAYVRRLFDIIAPRYDFLNHLLSLSLDVQWRKRAIDLLAPYKPRKILDVATGTADLAIEAARLRPAEIRGVDLSRKMLRLGSEKIARRGLQRLITLEEGSAEKLRYADGSYDAVTVAFGLRNFTSLDSGLAEIFRVLRPGGVVVILEFSRPRGVPFTHVYGFYCKRILPVVGGLLSGSRTGYDYLPSTVDQFPDGKELVGHLEAVGFSSPRYCPVTRGIATIYVADKPS